MQSPHTSPMNSRVLLLLLASIVGVSVGQVLLRLAAQAERPGSAAWQAVALSVWTWMGLLVYGLTTLAWLAVLRELPLRMAYPFVGVAFVVVPVLAWAVLGEELRWSTLAGAVLIVAGIWVSVR